MDNVNPAWLSPPYYKPNPQVRVDCGAFFGQRMTAETEMEMNTAELIGHPEGFLFGAAGSGNLTPGELVKSLIDYAVSLLDVPYAKFTAAGFDPTARAIFHANLIFDTLKRIPAGQGNASVYEVWTASKA